VGATDVVIDLREPQRQSRWAIAFVAFRVVRSIGTVQAVVAAFFILTRGLDGRLLIVLPVIALLLVTGSVLSWWRFTFHVVDGEFVVRSGVISVNRLSVPIARIQSISIEQELLHRLVGTVRVSLDTAGSEQTEFRIDAVPRAVADELRRVTGRTAPTDGAVASDTITAAAAATPTSADPSRTADDAQGEVLIAHDLRRLVTAALTSWPWASLVVLAPLFALLDQTGNDLPLPDIDADQARWWWVPLLVAGFVAVAVALNVVRMILQSWGLTVHADHTTLRRSSGLFSRRMDSRDATKVQIVSTGQNPLQRAFGLSTVTLSSIGDGSLEVIGCDAIEVDRFTQAAGSTPAALLAPQRRIHPAQIFLAVRNAVVIAALLGAIAALIVGWWAALAALLVPVTYVRARRHVEHFRWDATSSELVARGRIVDDWSRQSLVRTTNGVRVTRSLFERRRDLARVRIDTAAGSISIGMLPVEHATALRDHVLAAVLLDDDPWM